MGRKIEKETYFNLILAANLFHRYFKDTRHQIVILVFIQHVRQNN